MTPTRRQTSNRRNAQKSTGPKSEMGKTISSMNAVRHGLASNGASDPETEARIVSLAREFLDATDKNHTAIDLARDAAEAQIQIQRIQTLKKQNWKVSEHDDSITNRAEFWYIAHEGGVEDYFAHFKSSLKKIRKLMPYALERPFASEEERSLAIAVVATGKLAALVRYERQFANRRDRALRALTDHVS